MKINEAHPVSFPMPKPKAQEEPKKPIANVDKFKHITIEKGWWA